MQYYQEIHKLLIYRLINDTSNSHLNKDLSLSQWIDSNIQ
jgi:hypothetical protein